jgi:hypothetical protein
MSMAKYIPIGEPMNKAEIEAMRLLRDRLPDHYVVVGNFDLRTTRRRNSLEYDAVVIGEYAVYAVEVKGWRGLIEGDSRRWQPVWGRVENPFIKLEQKAKALRDFLVRSVPDFPREVFCIPVVLFPSDEVEFAIEDSWKDQRIRPRELWNFFVDEEQMTAHGPGPFSDVDLRERVVAAITPCAQPLERLGSVASYDIEGELERPNKPYREFVGSHRLLKNRSRVRIKAYYTDPLGPADNRDGHYNRILRDMEALGSLEDNPYVARPYETLHDREDEQIFYLVSEWVGPRTLADYIADESDKPWRSDQAKIAERWSYARHLVQAVSFIHQRKIVHRSLHPDAIYLTRSPNSVPLKLADFDHARVANLQSIAHELQSIGEEGYRAPELSLGHGDHDQRVDIFSLGVILYELLVGRPLFDNLSDVLRLEEIWQERRGLVGDGRVCAVLDGMLVADPSRRVADLEAALALFQEEAPGA